MFNNVTNSVIASLSDVSFSYKDKPILRSVSLEIRSGERLGIVGESGCGKSTLLKILAGLLTPDSGSATIYGKSTLPEIRKHVALVMQSPMLLPVTIYENITLGHEIPDERIHEVLKQASLLSWIESLPDGINTYLGDRADELSGGQAQRISIARALCKDAPILLLDEPTASLDSATAESVLSSLDAAAGKRTIVHVTHQVEYLKNYDRILHMKDGVLSEGGSAC
ncbi:MAG: ATP-binding cassette domain-containing protein [Clostridiales bacterium]|nr:ATP-binding cassette domain-containing protein [Clostridiales bacterium]